MAMQKHRKVKPQVLKGFRDYPPSEQIARERMIGKLREVVELMGFMPLQTPSLESAEALLGPHYGEDSLAELFGFRGPDDVDMALRYEFTLSLARYVAANPTLPLPFRRYQYGNVWRVDKPGPGRFREFMQFDIDIVGAANMLADAEIIATMVSTLDHLGVANFSVRYSTREILNGLIGWAGIPVERGPDVMRVVDKLERQGRDAVLLELGPGRVDTSGDEIKGLHLNKGQIDRIAEFLDVAEAGKSDPLQAVRNLLGETEAARRGVKQLAEIQDDLSALQVPTGKTEVDLTIVRGLGYYTGPVYETTLLDLPEYGSIFAGGRYDNLVERFLNKSIPATGSSVGIDRLLAALIELEALEVPSATSQVLVTIMDRERLPEYLHIVRRLREAGIPAEVYAGDTKSLTRQIKYGDKVGIPYAVIAGSDEFAAGKITVKDLAAGRKKALRMEDREEWLKAEEIQETIPAEGLIEYIKKRRVTSRKDRGKS